MSTDHNFGRERRAEAESNRGPSAYQPNALPLGQTSSVFFFEVWYNLLILEQGASKPTHLFNPFPAFMTWCYHGKMFASCGERHTVLLVFWLFMHAKERKASETDFFFRLAFKTYQGFKVQGFIELFAPGGQKAKLHSHTTFFMNKYMSITRK